MRGWKKRQSKKTQKETQAEQAVTEAAMPKKALQRGGRSCNATSTEAPQKAAAEGSSRRQQQKHQQHSGHKGNPQKEKPNGATTEKTEVRAMCIFAQVFVAWDVYRNLMTGNMEHHLLSLGCVWHASCSLGQFGWTVASLCARGCVVVCSVCRVRACSCFCSGLRAV